jgi:lysyl-tRNA synthetase, class I
MAQAAPTHDPIPADVRPWPALFALCLGFFMILVDTTIVTVATPAVVASFRGLASAADITNGDPAQISRIIGAPAADLEPRLAKAWSWAQTQERTTVRTSPDLERLAALNEDEELWLRQLLDRLPDTLELEETTTLVYGVPKLARGLGLDDAPTDQVKADQKAFFRLLYELLVDAERGPRLPTLFLALGSDTVRRLLTPPA